LDAPPVLIARDFVAQSFASGNPRLRRKNMCGPADSGRGFGDVCSVQHFGNDLSFKGLASRPNAFLKAANPSSASADR
jgi:hypothetical protein